MTKSNKTKLIARLILVVILLTSTLTLASCGNKGLENGFNPKGRLNTFMCAYKSDKTEFDIDDVTLTFYYGGHYWDYISGQKVDYSENLECECFELYFENENGDIYLIKKVEENFISDKYLITPDYKNYDLLFFYYSDMTPIFSHSEEIKIPRELFTDESGTIVFKICSKELVYVSNRDYVDDDSYVITGISIHYKKSGDKIILSAKGN
ncbi:MAG: hypothetical protein J6S23_03600 [Clostridia bacterium]|nr:hypothetical protein [Clostridia bacterium]